MAAAELAALGAAAVTGAGTSGAGGTVQVDSSDCARAITSSIRPWVGTGGARFNWAARRARAQGTHCQQKQQGPLFAAFPHSPRALQPQPAPEGAWRADQAARSGDPAMGSQIQEFQDLDHRRSGSTAARGSTGRALPPSARCRRWGLMRGLDCWPSTADSNSASRDSADSGADDMACASLESAELKRDPHGCRGIAGGASQSRAASCAPVDPTDPLMMAPPMQIGEIREPHGAYCLIQTASPGFAHRKMRNTGRPFAGLISGSTVGPFLRPFSRQLAGHLPGHVPGRRSGAS